jgi:hypothetical protein
MKTQKIYRLQVDGVGIYGWSSHENDCVQEVLRDHDLLNSDHVPSPSEDKGFAPHLSKIRDYENDFIFGFSSIPMLLKWFSMEVIFKLLKAGATVHVITISPKHVFSSDRQCIFLKTAVIDQLVLNTIEEVFKIVNEEVVE